MLTIDSTYDDFGDSPREIENEEFVSKNSKKNKYNLFNISSWFILTVGVVFLAIGIAFLAVGITRENNNIEKKEYDYIIIGGGTAGCIMAEKLSRNGKYSVFLMEAGFNANSDPIISNVDFAQLNLDQLYYDKYFWQATQVRNVSMPNAMLQAFSTGRVLGGASAVNTFIYTRGTEWMFDRWVNLTGDDIWDPVNVLNAYKEIETFYGTTGTPGTHGENGRLPVLQLMTTPPQTTVTSFSEKVVTAWSQLTGLSPIDDYNDMITINGPFNRWQFSAFPNATRGSSGLVFLTNEVLARRNLKVRTNTTALRIRFDDKNHARDVVYVTNGHISKIAVAKKRIILCAGLFSAPMLQHSGIGDADYLRTLRIPVIYNNTNVGRVMYTNQVVVSVFTKNVSDTQSANPADFFEAGAFLPNPTPLPSDAYETYIPSQRSIANVAINGGEIMILPMINLQIQTPGYVRIRNADPLRIPLTTDQLWVGPAGATDKNTTFYIYKNYLCALSNEFQGTGVGPVIDTDYLIVIPSASVCADDNQLMDFVDINPPGMTQHWTTSCSMGKIGDGISVTNGKGSVYGVTGLTIADSSILPQPIDGVPMAPAYLVASIIADQILLGNY